MKRLLLALCFVFFIPFLSFADEVDKGLPSDTSSRIKESARQVIQLGIKPDAVIKMTQSMISDNFTEQQIIAGHEILLKAKKQNLDLAEEDIINKLHEGIAKKQKAEKILQVMEVVEARYELANTYTQNLKMDDEQSRAMTKHIVDSLTAGVETTSMNKIMGMLQQTTKNASKDETIKLNEKTFETTRTMARSGVDSKDIVDVLNNAFNRKYNSGQMEILGNTFMTQARGSSSASELVRAYSDAIKKGAPPDKLGNFYPGMTLSDDGFTRGGIPTAGDMAGGSAPPPGGSAPPAGGGPPPPGGSAPPAGGGSSTDKGGAPEGPGSGPPGGPPGGGAPGGDRK